MQGNIQPVHGQALQTLALGWVLLVLSVSCILALWGGLELFRRRVVSQVSHGRPFNAWLPAQREGAL